MKKLLALAAIAAVGGVAFSTAPAQSAQQSRAYYSPYNAMAAAPGYEWRDSWAMDGITPSAAADPYAVYVDGRYAGADPDPTVRKQLREDYYNKYYGG